MSFKSTIFSQVLQQINRYDFKNQVSKCNGDHKTHIFSCFSLLATLMFAQLRSKKSLREVETSLNLIQSSFYHLGIKKVRRSSLSDALKARPHQVFEEYFYSLVDKLDKKAYKRFKRKLKSLDASTISFCLNNFKWAKYKSTKAGIKLHVLLDNDLFAPVQVLITNAVLHDIEPVKEGITFYENEMYVFDRGYNDYSFWQKINTGKAFFTTRLKKNANIEVVENRNITNKEKISGVIADQMVRLSGTNAHEYKEKLRMVSYHCSKTNKDFRFVTNCTDVSALEIANIYKDRWQIELFFKWIKQHLKVTKVLSTSENGVKTQIWIALITYLLILKIKTTLTQSDYSILEILRRIGDCLDKRINIFELLSIKFQQIKPDYTELTLFEGIKF